MDDFDIFSQPAQQTENTNIQEDDLFGPGNTDDATVAAPTNTDQQEDPSWVIENDLTSTPATQSNLFGDDTLDNLAPASAFDDDILNSPAAAPPSQATSFGGNAFTNQSTADALDAFPTTDLPPAANAALYNDQTKQQSEETSSYDMFSSPVSAPPINTNQTSSIGLPSTENLSPLQAFNTRRQHEIAEKDVEENRKIEELRKQAKQDLDRWYQDRQKRMEKQRQSIQHDEDELRTKSLQKSDKNSCDWAKIVRFLEFAQGTQLSKGKRDLNRMKSSIMHAKRDKDRQQPENGP